jgi:hypothetical protein
MLVRELARHFTAAERWAAGTEALERQAALGSLSFAAGFSGPGDSGDDLALAAVYASDSVARSDRHSLARSRAIPRLVQALEQTQSRRLTKLSAPTSPAFADEAACEAYLMARLRQRGRPCSRCGTATGCVLRSRKVWECGGCGLQTGLRFGTVMADSALPLKTWFTAICAILDRPAIETSELAELLGVSRRATVRRLARRIQEATAKEDAAELLAGLDGVARHSSDLSQAAAPTGVHRRKGRYAAQLEKAYGAAEFGERPQRSLADAAPDSSARGGS